MPLMIRKKIDLLILPFIALLLTGIGGCNFNSDFRQPEQDVIVSSHPQGKDIYVNGDKNAVSRTPTRLKLKESAKIEVESFGEHNVKEVLKDNVIFFTDSPLSIKEKFESRQYREIVEEMKRNLQRNRPLNISQKRYLAYSYFWLGNLSEAKAKLEELIEKHLESLSCSDQAEVFMYLGYCNLNLGNESKARKNFIDAFGCNLYLAHHQNAFWDKKLGNKVIKEAKHKVQMKSEPPPLDLFVVIDASKSIVEGKTGQINDLQEAVRDRLKPGDRVLFCRFWEVTKTLEFSNRLPSSIPIVKFEAIKAEWTDFSALFKKLHENIDARKRDEDSSDRQMAILIISDGEHSVKNNLGGFEERIPEDVSKAIENFETFYKNIPIAIVTLDRVDESKAIRPGSEYETLWTKELSGLCIGKSLYYESAAKQQEILKDIFDIITPARDKVLVMHQLEGTNEKNKRNPFKVGDIYKVKVEILCTLPKARLQVKCSPNWTEDKKIQNQFICMWESMQGIGEGPLVINGPLKEPRYETVEITVKNLDQASEGLDERELQRITLTFDQLPEQGVAQEKREVGTISFPFPEERPKIQITSPFGKKRVLLSGETASLKLLAKIDNLDHPEIIEAPEHPFKRPIHLTAEISEPDYTLRKKTVSIPINTLRDSSRNEFELTMEVGEFGSIVDEITDKRDGDNININFEAVDDSGTYFIDDTAVKKMRFRILPFILYWLYQFNLFVWAPLFTAILWIFYWLDKKEFEVFRKRYKILKKFSEYKLRKFICGLLCVFFVLLLLGSHLSFFFWAAISISSLILILMLWKTTKWALGIIVFFCLVSPLLALGFWLFFSLPNWGALGLVILILPLLIFDRLRKNKKDKGDKPPSSFRPILIDFSSATALEILLFNIVRVIKDFLYLYFL